MAQDNVRTCDMGGKAPTLTSALSILSFTGLNLVRFYRSLRVVKVLLAALRSTLTVLAPREEVRIGSR